VLADRSVDLPIADIKMPGPSGFGLARQAKLMRPNLHVIYLSGQGVGIRRTVPARIAKTGHDWPLIPKAARTGRARWFDLYRADRLARIFRYADRPVRVDVAEHIIAQQSAPKFAFQIVDKQAGNRIWDTRRFYAGGGRVAASLFGHFATAGGPAHCASTAINSNRALSARRAP
jgi:CheY-like chemotaxis protein